MESLFKKHFWVVTLLVVGLCAGFAGRAAAHLIEGAYLVSDAASAPVRRVTAPPPPLKVHAKDGAVIIARNIFCSACAPPKPADASPGAPVVNEWQKSSLQLELVSTMVCPSDDNFSMAIVRDLSTKEKDPNMYHKGSVMQPSGAEVFKVTAHRVYFKNGGRNEFVELEGSAAPAHDTAASPPPSVAMAPAIDPNLGDIDKGVTCAGSSCTIERGVVEKLLANTAMLATSARFVPSIKDGKPNGFKLFAIRPSSIFGRIGLVNGDVVKVINGSEMTTPDAALALYTKLRNASHLSVQVERNNSTVTLDYTIR